jgi:hypothetical protein
MVRRLCWNNLKIPGPRSSIRVWASCFIVQVRRFITRLGNGWVTNARPTRHAVGQPSGSVVAEPAPSDELHTPADATAARPARSSGFLRRNADTIRVELLVGGIFTVVVGSIFLLAQGRQEDARAEVAELLENERAETAELLEDARAERAAMLADLSYVRETIRDGGPKVFLNLNLRDANLSGLDLGCDPRIGTYYQDPSMYRAGIDSAHDPMDVRTLQARISRERNLTTLTFQARYSTGSPLCLLIQVVQRWSVPTCPAKSWPVLIMRTYALRDSSGWRTEKSIGKS